MNAALLRWLDRIGPRPFFAFVNYMDVHPPLLPPSGVRGHFASGPGLERRKELDIGAIPGNSRSASASAWQRSRDHYDECILGWDETLGALLAELEQRGLRDNTLIVLTSDHGESFGEHGFSNHGHSLYREQVEVPMVLSWPARLGGGIRLPGPVGIDQVPATLLDAAGLSRAGFPGRSLLDTTARRSEVLVEVARRSVRSFDWPSSRGWVAGLGTGDWWLLLNEDGTTALFNAAGDSAQATNLADSSAYHGLVDSLMSRMDRSTIEAGLTPGRNR